jgi:hypothetical protein
MPDEPYAYKDLATMQVPRVASVHTTDVPVQSCASIRPVTVLTPPPIEGEMDAYACIGPTLSLRLCSQSEHDRQTMNSSSSCTESLCIPVHSLGRALSSGRTVTAFPC